MRTVKSASTKVDYTKPVKIEDFELKDGDCFGRLFDITERLCLMCADRINCQNIYNTIELRERVSLKILNLDRKSTRLNSSHSAKSRMPSSA